MNKTIIVLLCFLLILGLSACASTPEPESVPDQDDEIGNWEDEMAGGEEGFPDDMFVPDLSDTHNEDLVAAFTPDGAYIHSDIESMLVLTSEKPMPYMIDFCLAAAEKLGIQKTDVDDSNPGFWTYNGTLGNLSIHIELRDDGDSVNLMLLY